MKIPNCLCHLCYYRWMIHLPFLTYRLYSFVFDYISNPYNDLICFKMFFNCLLFKIQVFKRDFLVSWTQPFLLKLFHILLNGLKTQFYLRSRNVTNYLQRQYILVPLPCGLYTGNIMIITSSNHSLKKRFFDGLSLPLLDNPPGLLLRNSQNDKQSIHPSSLWHIYRHLWCKHQTF